MKHILSDNAGRRIGVDRRQFSYTIHIPEGRSGKERRNGLDRRLKLRTSDPININLNCCYEHHPRVNCQDVYLEEKER